MSDTPETTVSQPPPERVFPPWSAGRIVFWIAVGVVLSIVIGALIGVAVATLSIWITGGIDSDFGQVTGSVAALLQGSMIFALIWFLLNRKGYSLADAWGSFSIEWRQLGLVTLAGVAFISAADLVIRVLHLDSPFTRPAWDWRILWANEILITCLTVPFAEELLFRGLLFRAFRLRFSSLHSAFFSSLIFAIAHTHYLTTPPRLVTVFLMGLVCAYLVERTRSLTPGVVFHFVANFSAATIYFLAHYSP